MDRLASRKLQLSELQGKTYENANRVFDEYQNEITFLLAQEYLEKGKIDPRVSVVKFLKEKGAKGFIQKTDPEDSTGVREIINPVDGIAVIEEDEEFVFPCLVEINGVSVIIKFIVEKIKEKDNTKKTKEKEPVKNSKETTEHLMNFRTRRK